MRTCTTLLAIFAFGLHLLLGCCWHHAHGADELQGHQHDANGLHVHLPQWLTPSTASAAKCCSHKHSHGKEPAHEHSQPTEGEAPATPHAPCSDPQCVYMVSSPVQVDAAQDISLPVMLIDQQFQVAEFRIHIEDLAGHEKISPHLRRHLALSRLLN